jgi:hypothetical protein
MRLSSRIRRLETTRGKHEDTREAWTRRWTSNPKSHAVFEAAKAEARRLAPGMARRNAEIDAGLCSVALTIGVELIAEEFGGREQGEQARLAFFQDAARYQRTTGDLFPVPGFGLREWGMGAEIKLPIRRERWRRPGRRAATPGAA